MKKTAIALILGVITLASAISFHALAEPPGPPPGPPPHGAGFFGGPPGPPPGPPPHGGGFFGLLDGPPDLIERLNLTDDQLKEMRLAYVDSQGKTRKARCALMGLHDEKRTMLVSGKIDQAKLAKLDEEITKLASEVMGEDLKMKREHLSKLTPEQLNLLADFMARKKIAHGPKMKAR
jgi:Spy/CpxP family protein refolding chaperone